MADFTGRSCKGDSVGLLVGVNVGQVSEAMSHLGNLEKKGVRKESLGTN